MTSVSARTSTYLTPSITVARNALGGRVAVLAVSLMGNRSSGLYNFRKQEVLRNLFQRLVPESLPVAAVGAPGIWLLASVAADGQEMLVMVNNLSGDVRDDVRLAFSGAWRGASVARLGADGSPVPCGQASAEWKVPFVLGQMQPEFLLLKR